jgi:hypothetical protein
MRRSYALHLIVLAFAKTGTGQQRTLFRFAENSSEGIAGNLGPNCAYWPSHSIRRLKKRPDKTA